MTKEEDKLRVSKWTSEIQAKRIINHLKSDDFEIRHRVNFPTVYYAVFRRKKIES